MIHELIYGANKIVLEPGKIHKFEASRGTQIIACQGMLWLTVTGCSDDHFLSARQSYRVKRKGLVLIEAAEELTISFSILRDPHHPLALMLWRTCEGVWPVQRLKARWNALGSEKPNRKATSPSARCLSEMKS